MPAAERNWVRIGLGSAAVSVNAAYPRHARTRPRSAARKASRAGRGASRPRYAHAVATHGDGEDGTRQDRCRRREGGRRRGDDREQVEAQLPREPHEDGERMRVELPGGPSGRKPPRPRAGSAPTAHAAAATTTAPQTAIHGTSARGTGRFADHTTIGPAARSGSVASAPRIQAAATTADSSEQRPARPNARLDEQDRGQERGERPSRVTGQRQRQQPRMVHGRPDRRQRARGEREQGRRRGGAADEREGHDSGTGRGTARARRRTRSGSRARAARAAGARAARGDDSGMGS